MHPVNRYVINNSLIIAKSHIRIFHCIGNCPCHQLIHLHPTVLNRLRRTNHCLAQALVIWFEHRSAPVYRYQCLNRNRLLTILVRHLLWSLIHPNHHHQHHHSHRCESVPKSCNVPSRHHRFVNFTLILAIIHIGNFFVKTFNNKFSLLFPVHKIHAAFIARNFIGESLSTLSSDSSGTRIRL